MKLYYLHFFTEQSEQLIEKPAENIPTKNMETDIDESVSTPEEFDVADESITDGNEYSCNICKKQFIYKKNLIVHKKLHKALDIYKEHQSSLTDPEFRNDFLTDIDRLIRKIRSDQNINEMYPTAAEMKSEVVNKEMSSNQNYQSYQPYPGTISSHYLEEGQLFDRKDNRLVEWAKQCMEKQPFVALKRLNIETDEQIQNKEKIKQEYPASTEDYYGYIKHEQGEVVKQETYSYRRPSTDSSVPAFPGQSMRVDSNFDSEAIKRQIAEMSDVPANKERKFPCKICGKAFKSPDNLKIHLRIHIGSKPYECLECGKRFRQKCHINNHMLIHKGIKPWKCKECDMSFRQVSNLLKHQKKHMRE